MLYLAVVILLYIALLVRAAWINEKVSALTKPSSITFIEANANLPHKGAQPRVVLIGDSRVSRWPASEWTTPWEIINRGIGGETVAQLATRFRSDAVRLDPDVIVIELGINDLVAASFMGSAGRQKVVYETAKTLGELTKIGSASGSSVLVATIIPPAQPDILMLPVWRESLRSLVAELNSMLRQSRLPNGARLVDFASVLESLDDRSLPNIYRLDTGHLNELAYKRLTAALDLILKETVEDRNWRAKVATQPGRVDPFQ